MKHIIDVQNNKLVEAETTSEDIAKAKAEDEVVANELAQEKADKRKLEDKIKLEEAGNKKYQQGISIAKNIYQICNFFFPQYFLTGRKPYCH